MSEVQLAAAWHSGLQSCCDAHLRMSTVALLCNGMLEHNSHAAGTSSDDTCVAAATDAFCASLISVAALTVAVRLCFGGLVCGGDTLGAGNASADLGLFSGKLLVLVGSLIAGRDLAR